MIIKEIIIHGFKSFKEKTIIKIDEPVVGIVGPNGCGKSNVVDAMKWVLGEKSAKSLRGGAMDDVIYNGGEKGKGSGMAEVSITFGVHGGKVPPKYLDFQEIQITRRLYKNGESEYLINKTQCRLKDIYDIIMGTGAGARAYAIVSQGHIEKFTMAKPFERRFYIEEAADITRYKVRKEAAERKITSTKQNLLRLQDIIRELQKQNSSLKRQAEAAEKFKNSKEKLRDKDLKLSSSIYLKNRNKMIEENKTFEELKDEICVVETEINKKELSIEHRKLAVQEEESFISSLQDKVYEGKRELLQLDTDIKLREKEIEEVDIQSEKDVKYVNVLEEKKTSLQKERSSLSEDTAPSKELDEEKINLEEAQKNYRLTKEKLAIVSANKEEHRSKIISALTSMSQARNKLQFIDQNMTAQEVQIERKKKEKNELLEKKIFLEEKRGLKEKELQLIKTSKEEADIEKEELSERLLKWKEELSENRTQFDSVKNDLTVKSSRLSSLEELRDNYDGYQDGVKSLMLDYPQKENLHGLISDYIEVESEYEAALESVLGERLQGVVINNVEAGGDAISHLRSESAGRSSFLPLDVRANLRVAAEGYKALSDVNSNSFIGYLRDKVKIKDKYASLADYLLNDVALVDNLDSALRLWKDEKIKDTMVTLEGDVITPEGLISGGSLEAISTGILHKKREIEELNQKIDELEIKHTLISETIKRIDLEVEDAEIKTENLRKHGHAEELKILTLEKDISALNDDIDRIVNNIHLNDLEIERLAEEQKTLDEERRTAQKMISENESANTDVENEVKKLEFEEKDLRETLESDSEKITQLKVNYASLKERFDSLKSRTDRIDKDIDETINNISSFTSKIEEAGKRKTLLSQEIVNIKSKIGSLAILSEKAESTLKGRREKFLVENKDITEVESSLKILRGKINTKQSEFNQINILLSETKMKLENLSNDIFNKYGDNLEEVSQILSEDGKIIDSEEGFIEIKEEIQKIKTKLESMGEVNIMAIEEYKKVSERLEFLLVQRKDLEKAVELLEKTIVKINKTSAERFEIAFNAINEQFKRIFPKLFKGGSASLVLTDPEDLLSTGVDIVVQPPGKKFQNINLFSGGEKALTAISLIFSIFLINPAPFCVLDEVDAPLDDSNITRFNSIIKEMSVNTQFVLITHNKRTMEVANKLYGITLEEAGHSKLVSVKFVEKE